MLSASLNKHFLSFPVFRNMSVDGGHEVCDEMIHKDVLTPLVAFFQKVIFTFSNIGRTFLSRNS